MNIIAAEPKNHAEIVEAMFARAPKHIELTRHIAIKFTKPYLAKHPQAAAGFREIERLKGFVLRNSGLPYAVDMSRDGAYALLHIQLEREDIFLTTSLQEASIFMQLASERPTGFHLAVSLEGHNAINTLPVKKIKRVPK